MGKESAVRKVQEVRPEVEQFVAQLRQKLYARGCPDWGTLFSQIEELGVQLGDMVCREFIEQVLREQAAREAESGGEPRCPTCGQPVAPDDPEPRPVLTRRGPIAWLEPKTYCAKCRKAFFPSVEEFGDSGG